MRQVFILCAVLLVTVSDCLAQAVPVFLDTTVQDSDQVGMRFAFELKEEIRGSLSFRLVEASKEWPYLRVSLVTIEGAKYVSTLIAVAYSFDDIDQAERGALLSVRGQQCGSDKVRECARDVLASMDQAVDALGKSNPALRKRLR